MTTGRFLSAAVAGGLTLFVGGFLLWGILLDPFFQAHLGSATGVLKEPMDVVSLSLGQFFYALLLATVIGKWAGVSGFGSGFKIGLIFGLLISLAVGLTQYSMANIVDLTATLVDPLVAAVWAGLGGGVIGLVLGGGQAEEAA
jgi:hypothetical protein